MDSLITQCLNPINATSASYRVVSSYKVATYFYFAEQIQMLRETLETVQEE